MQAVQKAAGLDTYDVDDDTVVMHLASRRVHKLNPTAAFIWDLLDTTQNTEALAQALSAAAEIELPRAQQDVAALIEKLLEQGLLQPLTTS